ncbi:MAG: hypothetical protein JRC93_09170 [Deltaproteobacteria bacterium]|nr:hypothetical protein [Deltaproteobacteria bacterium]
MAKLDKVAALQSRKDGATVNEIALSQGVTYQAVWRYLKTQNIDLQDKTKGVNLSINGEAIVAKKQIRVTQKEKCPNCGGDLERWRIRDGDGNITACVYQCTDCEAIFE